MLNLDEVANEMVVSQFATRDPDVVQYFAEIPTTEREPRFETALKVGVTALRTIGTAERVDYVEKRFNQLRETFERNLEEVFGEHGEVEHLVEDYFGERGQVPEAIEEIFGDNGQLARILEQHFGPDGKIVKDIFDPSTKGTPLAKLKEEIERQLVELRKDLGLAAQAEEIAEVTPIKGRKFEDDFEEMVCDVARPLGDIVERTTDTPGLVKRSKKGDFVVTISDRPDIKLVFETRDTGTVSLHKVELDMKEALENRGASYGIFVARRIDTLPRSVGWFNEYWRNILVLALTEGKDSPVQEEILRVGYKWARIRALASEAAIAEGIDATRIGELIEDGRRSLRRFMQVRTQCTNAKQAVDAILQELNEIESTLQTDLDAIGTEILKVAP